MKRLILHIGPHKTGSTYLQGELLKQRSALANSGILYPDCMLEMWGHTGLANAIKINDVTSYRTELDAINSYNGDVIISSENFFNMNAEQIEALAALFKAEEVILVAFFRQPTIRLVSLWHEFVKSGMPKSYSEFVIPHITRPVRSFELNILGKINIFKKAFRNPDVRIVDYEKAVAEKSTIKSFFKSVGFGENIPIQENWNEVNKRVNFKDIEVLRCLNVLASDRNSLSGHKLRMSYFSNRKMFSEVLSDHIFPIMSKHMEPISVGVTYTDKILLDLIDRQFPEAIDRTRAAETEVVFIAQSNWLFEDDVIPELRNIYDGLCAL